MNQSKTGLKLCLNNHWAYNPIQIRRGSENKINPKGKFDKKIRGGRGVLKKIKTTLTIYSEGVYACRQRKKKDNYDFKNNY